MEGLNEFVLFKEVQQQTRQRVPPGEQVERKGVKAPSIGLTQVSLRDSIVAQVEKGDGFRVNALLETLTASQGEKEVDAFLVELI